MFSHDQFRLYLKNHIRPLYCIWYAKNKKSWWKTRYILSAFTGVFSIWLICKVFLLSFVFSKENENFIIRWSIILLGLGFVFTDTIKCIIFLTFIAILNKYGRTYLRALCFTLIISGPIQNLSTNVGEVVRVFSCSIVLTYNLTRTRYDLLTKPFQRTLAHMKDDIDEVKNTFQSLKNITSVVHEEIMGDELVNKEFIKLTEESESVQSNKNNTIITMDSIDNVIDVPIDNSSATSSIETELEDDVNFNKENASTTASTIVTTTVTTTVATTIATTPSEGISNWFSRNYKSNRRRKRKSRYLQPNIDPNYVLKKYKNKMKKRCIKQLEDGKQRCKNTFQETFDKCYDTLPPILNSLLCWPLKIDFICNINFLGNPDNLCDPSDAIADYVGKIYARLTNVEDNLYSENSRVIVTYKVASFETIPDLHTAYETAREVKRQFYKKKEVFDAFLVIMRRIFSSFALWIVYSSYRYHKRYKKDLQYDNVYITDYFKRIDKRRQKDFKNPILPLKKYERRNIVLDESNRLLTVEERRDLTFFFFLFFMEMFTGLFFLCLDYTISALLQLVRDHAEVQFVQDGEHTIKVFVEGTGLIARLLRSTLHNFNMHEVVHTKLSNKQCLPRPSFLPTSFYVKLFVLYAAVLFLISQGSRFLCLRRIICSYFYRKQEKRRIIFLYNSIMKKRHTLIKEMIQQAKLNFVDRKVRRTANIFLRLRLECPTCFRWLGYFRFAQHKCLVCDEYEDINFVYCYTPQCGAVYCYECWTDLGDNCIICNGIISHNITINFYDFFEDFTFIQL